MLRQLLEAIGRGAEKPSKMAGRLGTVQTNLSRLLQQLLDASILERELPFGESLRSTKRTYYRIQDPTLRFWFRVYSPHRTRWHHYDNHKKAMLIHEHASTVFEDFCRQQYPGAARYWERNLEFDLIRSERGDGGQQKLIVSEVKWRRIRPREKQQLLLRLEETWQHSGLQKRYPHVSFEVLDADILK